MNTPLKNIEDAYDLAASRGVVPPNSKSLVINGLNATTLPARIGGSLDFGTTYPAIVKLIIDASGSMGSVRQEVVDALNRLKVKLEETANRTGAEFQVSITDFSGLLGIHLMRDFEHVDTLKPFTARDYNPDGSTPLCDAAYQGISETIAHGTLVYGTGATGYQQAVVILSDGADNDSRHTPADIATLLKEFVGRRNFIIAFIGFGAGQHQRDVYTSIAQEMGIPAQNLRVYDPSDPNCLDMVVTDISSSVEVRSQRAASSQTQSGNFFVTP